MPDPRSCIGSLSALGPVQIANDVVAQSISGSATEGTLERFHCTLIEVFGRDRNRNKIEQVCMWQFYDLKT